MSEVLKFRRWVAWLLAAALLIFPPLPAFGFFGGLTVEKEKQLGEEFLLELQQVANISSDPFLVSYLNRLGQKLVAQLGPQPFQYRFFILEDPSINAFAVPGGYIFVTTGMIRMIEREGELAGVLAHEISHIYARHMAKQVEKSKITNLATLVGALAAVLIGGGAFAEPLLVGTMAGSASAMLKYSRDMEHEADSLAFRWMLRAGYNPHDMVSVFHKMSRQRWFEGGKIPVYLSTHPEIESRMVELGHQLTQNRERLPRGENSVEFEYFRQKMQVLFSNPAQLLRHLAQDCAREPTNPVYHYGRALALSRLERSSEAVAAFQQALRLSPGNPLIQRDLAVHLFQQGHYDQARELLESLSQSQPRDEVLLFYLGRLYMEQKNIDKALALMEKVHNLNPAFIEVYHTLGTLYGEKGKMGLAHYYLGFHSLKAKAYPIALFHFRKALPLLPNYDHRHMEVKNQIARLEKMRVRVSY